jgi:hypothetical protein
MPLGRSLDLQRRPKLEQANCGGPGVCDALRPPPANHRRAFAQSDTARLHWGTTDASGGGPGVWAASYRPATLNCPLTRIRHGPGRKPAAAWVTLWVTRVAQTTPSIRSGRGGKEPGERLDQDEQLRR